MKFAYAQRMFLGDANYVQSALDLAKNLTKKEYAEYIARRIPSRAQEITYYGGPNQTQWSRKS
ncbi:hypothetical protein OESDEN_24059 [Oesophagostomum dentatum]|uniref:Uncharacterized protein n=1 Tax=Oesophagostomum dentatum TaxID=61180 RepID=A0A0B1RXF4_OESDE|nr:hypothetical protein OESDEN_24059 [Oesophagostomum dentatum]